MFIDHTAFADLLNICMALKRAFKIV